MNDSTLNTWQQERQSRMDVMRHDRQLAVTDSTTDLVAILDVDGFISQLNPAGYELLELAWDADLISLRFPSMFTKDSARNYINTEIPRALMHGASHSELEINTRSGNIIPVSQVLIAQKDANDALTHFSVILRNISSIREAETERQYLLKQLQQNKHMESLGRLAGGVAHDYNNLMTVIMGNAELGLLNLNEGKTCRSELEVIGESARKAARLSSQLLDFCSKQMIEPQVLNLNEVLENSMNLLRSMMGEEIDIELDCAEDLWPVRIDRSQLEQIILNLSVNARDAMSFRGIFQQKTKNTILTSEQAIAIGLDKGGAYVEFSVMDNGCGIEEGILENIFDPFFTTKEKGKGTGLGLSAVYGSIKQNKGCITVTSTPGEGTTFNILFPRSEGDDSHCVTEINIQESTSSSPGSERIMLVEDDASVRSLLSKVLTNLGYTVLEAVNGKEALEILAREKQCDLVISDIIMPIMNGMELFGELKENNYPAKVILMSGHNEEFIDHDKLVDRDITLLKKPFQPKRFAKIIRDVLDGLNNNVEVWPA